MTTSADTPKLPYFDDLLQKLAAGDEVYTKVFGQHVHWGYWAEPDAADVSTAGFSEAQESMCQQVVDAARIRNGMSILDVGCGFGGTIANMNARFDNLELVGLNIDARQLTRAEKNVVARASNKVRFVLGDACAPPFADGSFDVVLAAESIFHFDSRIRFLKEARRLLKPTGRLVISDVVPRSYLLPLLFLLARKPGRYGRVTSASASLYRVQARMAGLRIVDDRDLTRHTLPTFPALYTLGGSEEVIRENQQYEKLTRGRQVTYHIFVLEPR